jgi:hypothetical protein
MSVSFRSVCGAGYPGTAAPGRAPQTVPVRATLDLAPWQWSLVIGAALVVGLTKTAMSGAGPLAAALFALALPARQSTGILLPLLILGDVMAVVVYRRHANWPLLLRLMPWLALGVVSGAGFLTLVDDGQMRVVIGVILLLLVGGTVADRKGRLRHLVGADRPPEQRGAGSRVVLALAGTLSGFATMVANSAGPIMTVYLLLSSLAVLQFMGTTSWLYLMVNLFKLPFSLALGLIGPSAVRLDLALVPVMLLGGGLGVLLVRRVSQGAFERVALALSGVSAVLLLV